MGLVGLILASLINIFMHSAAINFAISLVGVVVFMGLTAWDTQKLKEIYYYSGDESGQKIAIMGAFSLYLDFINLFLSLLNFFGEKKED
jgi:FtsH-binding integral membrane protein